MLGFKGERWTWLCVEGGLMFGTASETFATISGFYRVFDVVALIRQELGTVGLLVHTPGIHSAERCGHWEATGGAISLFSSRATCTVFGPQMGITVKGKALSLKVKKIIVDGRLI